MVEWEELLPRRHLVDDRTIRYWKRRGSEAILEALPMFVPEKTYYYLVIDGKRHAKATPPLVNNLKEAKAWAEKWIRRLVAKRV